VPTSWGGGEYDPYNMRPLDANLNSNLGSKLTAAIKDLLRRLTGKNNPKNTKLKITGADVEGC
jgi:hypothetical protein